MPSSGNPGAADDSHASGDSQEIDRRFREIVSGLGTPGDGYPNPPIDAGDPGSRDGDDRRALPTGSATPVHGPGTPEGMATDFRSYQPPDEDDHFVPDPPPPLPVGDLHFMAILGCMVAGPLLVLLSAVVPVLGRGWTAVGAIVTVAGFVLLVLRQPRRRGPERDWGAQV